MNEALFELNTPELRKNLTEKISAALLNLEAKGAIDGSMVLCDNWNNPKSVINDNRCNVDIFLYIKDAHIQWRIEAARSSVNLTELRGEKHGRKRR